MVIEGWEKVDRKSQEFKACQAVMTAGGAIVGMTVGAPALHLGVAAGAIGGGLLGFVTGYIACPYLAPAAKRKLKLGQPLTDLDLQSAAEAMAKYSNVSNATDALKLISIVRPYATTTLSTQQPPGNPSQDARLLLSNEVS